MGIETRRDLFRQIESIRKRPLIVYATSPRQHAHGMMGGDSVAELVDQINKVPAENRSIDLMVISHGGDGTVAWQTMSLLRERFDHVSVLIPQAAYSAATLMALGANEIVMHRNANLGPVDPQMSGKRWHTGAQRPVDVHFGYEDLLGFLEFIKEEVGITEQALIKSLFEQFCQEVGPVPIGTAARGSLLSISMGEKLLRMHMKEEGDDITARGIAETLNKKFFHHGYPVSRKEAAEIGLRVASKPEDGLEEKMWEVWLDIEEELQCREPFDPTVVAINGPAGDELTKPVPQVNLPANLPPPVLQALIPQILQALGQAPHAPLVSQCPAVDYKLIHVICESHRHASRCITFGKILATRMPDLDLRVSVIPAKRGWITLDPPAD